MEVERIVFLNLHGKENRMGILSAQFGTYLVVGNYGDNKLCKRPLIVL